MRRLRGVVPGLDPGIHADGQRVQSYLRISWVVIMDCRVKLGNDGEGVEPQIYARFLLRAGDLRFCIALDCNAVFIRR
jgi:hypothetical protein